MNPSEKTPVKFTPQAFADINAKSDVKINIALSVYFVVGIVLAFFYDTYLIAIGVGTLCLASYYGTKLLLPHSPLYRYVLAVVVGVFSAQYIYQMHGMFEMHFMFFVGSALLITYQNWRLQIPLLVFIVLHHGIFAYLQFTGMKDVYFTQLEFMDLETFLFHATIATLILYINALWGYSLGKRTRNTAAVAEQLGDQLKHIGRNIAFADEISKGNLNTQYVVTENDDELGKSLLKMQHNIVQATERERADKYITQGVASIGEILRRHADNVEILSNELISDLTRYTQSNQGCMFLREEDENGEPYLKITAAYAYDRRKFMEGRVEIGDSLVGQCFLEKQIIMLTQVPKDYVKITSGLGLATPSCVIIIPLLANEEVTGVLEFASFTNYTEGQVEFFKKASEAIAISLLSVKTTERIKSLLTDSQQREEEMRAQEEEMRQNMEELSATQEEMRRNSIEMESRVDAINNSGIAAIEFELDGTILTANNTFLKLMGYTLEEIQGKHHRIFVDKEYAQTTEYRKFWELLGAGIPQPGEYERVKKNGAKIYINGSYSIITDQNGNATKILKLATDITEAKVQMQMVSQQEEEMRRRATELENRIQAIADCGIASIEFALDGTIIDANVPFLEMMGYALHEIQGKHHRIFVKPEYTMTDAYRKFWNDLRQGIAQPGEYERVSKKGEEVLLRGSYSVIRDHKQNPLRILKMATMVTNKEVGSYQ
ncbi:PAS domain S-box protein [Fulvivirgaceae bacterium PWU5]|uniref:PAS domain S-box protein n=1 Tax=Dawidia cretensis TaxID=2782350 RepID=A0AAP2E2R3_9BACT|nr:PAS domain S-box protein [Dawidia cretensis]MBT1710527.1 PAS domain S-box protein [Dawidia cretensis]